MELEHWIDEQALFSAERMKTAISGTDLQRVREPFRQIIVPAKGSVLASPVIADWDPEPDYFFHWVRDSAIVMQTVAELAASAAIEADREYWSNHFSDFVRFSLGLTRVDCAEVLRNGSPRGRTTAEFQKFVSFDSEIAELTGDRLLAEPRFNPDGTLDVLRWSRPQYDGPALRALACLRYLTLAGTATQELSALLRGDLEFTVRWAAQPCIGPWEEPAENTHHYYVAVVQLGAIVHGQKWLAPVTRTEAETKLRAQLEAHWSPVHEVFSDVYPARSTRRDQNIDSSCLLGVLDADLPSGPHSVDDPRVWKTLAALEYLFAHEFPINRGRAAPALGRSGADRYFGGGAWYVTTLAAASLCYQRAIRRSERRKYFFRRGDDFMRTVQQLTPASGVLSEQIDRTTGAQVSARDLTWSYAAFIKAARLRTQAADQIGSSL